MGVYAVIRAHPNARWPRLYAAIGALVTLGIGIPFASNIVRGIGQPPWGSTPGLWLSWEIPLFVFLFAVLLTTYWFLRMAFGKPGSVSFRAGVIIASISAIVALGGLWSTTLRQRMRLAEEDVAALGHVDDYAVLLTRSVRDRFGAIPAAEESRGAASGLRVVRSRSSGIPRDDRRMERQRKGGCGIRGH